MNKFDEKPFDTQPFDEEEMDLAAERYELQEEAIKKEYSDDPRT